MRLLKPLVCIIFGLLSVFCVHTFFGFYFKKPKVSIITSMYDADEFIEEFLRDITRQTIFDQCELIIINANSPGNEESIIQRYKAQYSNIRYVKLDYDPGIYGVWNIAIQMANAPFITNANCDDRRNPESIAQQAQALELYPSIDLVYQDYMVTRIPNQTFENNNRLWTTNQKEFSHKNMQQCLPGPMPMWRKSMHEKYGYFDETFKSAGDWEMWLRAVDGGACFKKISGICGLFYWNPKGLSNHTEVAKKERHETENGIIIKNYNHIWS